MCDCISKIDEKLAEHNSRLQVAFTFRPMSTRVHISTEKLVPRKRESMGAVATFCPFCGERYAEEAA
jgi:hypothetical protein